MKIKTKKCIRRMLALLSLISLTPLLDACSSSTTHNGRLPFSLAESPLENGGETMDVIVRNEEPGMPSEAAANTDETTDYLLGKRWVAYRPGGTLDIARLHEFSRQVIVTARDAKHAYDYAGALGFYNRPYEPDFLSDIGDKYSCTTLILAGLHYSGYTLDAVHRKGWFDIVTPRQVVDSSVRDSPQP